MTFLPDAVRWYLTLVVATWALAPIARFACGRLADRGAFVARPFALLAVVWPNWFLASISPIPYSTAGLWAAVVVLGAAGWFLTLRSRQPLRDWIKLLLVAEGVSLVVFAGYAVLRGYAPNIAGTEKPMDEAMLAVNARTTNMPPPDMWMSGEKINYYYLGYTVSGAVARMSDVPSWVGFNLALAMTYAMAVCAAVGLAFNVARAWLGRWIAIAAGALGAFFVMFAGNMYTPVQLLEHPERTWNTWWWGGIGWKASRIVVDAATDQPTINEFPSFSFVLGDFHPHVSALPFTMLALALAMNFLLTPRNAEREFSFSRLTGLALAGAAIGALYPMNSWDFPTYLAAALLAIGLGVGWNRKALVTAAIVAAASVIAWAPFIITFVPFATGTTQSLPSLLRNIPGVSGVLKSIALYRGPRTSVSEFLTVFGMPWLISIVYFAVRLARRPEGSELRLPRAVLIPAAITAVIAILWPAPVLILAGAPLVAGIVLLWHEREQPVGLDSVVSLLFSAGWALVLITEFFFLRDVFGGRMNTLFKIYYQVWTLTGIGSALAIVSLWLVVKPHLAGRSVLIGAVTVALIAGLTYPVISERAWVRVNGPVHWYGLDGAAFIGTVAPGDLDAIHWLADNAKSNDVVLEAPGCSYEVNSSYATSGLAAFTGVPTVIGWAGHEGQWRGGQPSLESAIVARDNDVATMYANPSSPLIAQYKITLLFVGKYETDGTPSCTIAGPYSQVSNPSYPGPGWTLIYQDDGARIYRKTN